MPIGKFVLHAACLQNKLWQEAGHEAISVAVNLSGRQFDQKNLIAQIYKILNDTGLSPQYLELEVTESTVMRDPEKAIQILQELKAAGIQIALDDFGTGYSSLSYLKRLPLDAVKIDISFVRNITTNPNDAVIARTIIAMAHSLNLKTIAEGVENEQQLAFLKEHGCDVMQGFLLSPALPPDEFLRLLASK
jgi:EAL domain-containing protein (putative c-di-GMP-specific phosphodiesterase class I)